MKNTKSDLSTVVMGIVILLAGIMILTSCGSSVLSSTYEKVAKRHPDAWMWCDLAEDGSYLHFDSNPYDEEEFYDSKAIDMLEDLNDAFGLPKATFMRMGKTRSMDGRQEFSSDKVTVTWTYHPDKGLEVMYEPKKK